MRCRLGAFAPAVRPHRAGVVPKWYVVFLAFLLFLVFFSFFQAWCPLEKKRSNALPKWSTVPSRPRCQGRVVFRVHRSAAETLDQRKWAARRSLHAGRAGRKKQFRWEGLAKRETIMSDAHASWTE